MQLTTDLDAPVAPAPLFAVVEDLARYPAWLDIVPRAEPVPSTPGEGGPAWSVDLRARIGPFARRKRLRMVRTVHAAGATARFERAELDGRDHSPWVLTVRVAPTSSGSRLTMDLHYGGGLFGPAIERVLTEEIERSKPRLLALLRT